MADAEPEGDWLRTLTLRLQAWYGTDGGGDPDAAALGDELARRLQALPMVADDRYRLGAPIATGGMGVIWNALDTALGRELAVKRATADAAGGLLRARLRLLDEAATLGRLQHPGIVPIHELARAGDGEPFFAMPKIAGRSLAQLLAAGGDAAQLPRLLDVLRRVAETMAHAHARGIVHRDLKPANVMIGPFGEVFVMDWGLACELGSTGAAADAGGDADASPSITLAGTIPGTPAYMAPERVAEPPPPVAAAIDVYALGAMLYEVLAGAPPYVREQARWTAGGLLQVLRTRPPQPLRERAADPDAELIAICERAMARDPAQRYAGMRQLADDLWAWSQHRIVAAAGGGPGRQLRKWLQRNRAVAATAAAALVVLLLGGIWFVVHLARARDVANAALREVLDLAVADQVADLRRRADQDLWPAVPATVPAMLAWLQEAERLRPVLANLQARRTAAAPDPAVPERERAWRTRLLDDAIAQLTAFLAPVPAAGRLSLDSSQPAVVERVAAARALAAATVDEAEVAARWREAGAAIARSPVYGGLQLRPQVGLLPLGPDPASGLHEFAHLPTGRPAVRRGGRVQPDADTGVVLVLLPGGTFRMGAAPDDAEQPDPLAETINETPVHAVTLAPFFLARHEFTQGQWQRVTGGNPSVHTAISAFVDDDRAAVHPVESVDWWTARALLHKLGLRLPTEAQWEYAARAGSRAPWGEWSSVAQLAAPARANLADASSARALGTQGFVPTPGLDDGFVMHAPVGSFAPNAFGLHDLLGNVAEWCEDEYVSYRVAPTAATGARPRDPDPTTVMFRGGAFDLPAPEARVANRAGGPPTRRHFGLGLRAARALDP